MEFNFSTADLIDIEPATPSCECPFFIFGQRKKFSGKIRTVYCYQDNALVKKLMNTDSDGEVLVVDGGGSLYSALMGDLIAEAGQKHGWAGAVIYGAIRDSETIDQLDFGIKALGTNPRKSNKEGKGNLDIPLFFGGICFNPGDYLYSDRDGILVTSSPFKL